LLSIENLKVVAENKDILKGLSLQGSTRAKCTPSWGPTVTARARSRARWRGHPAYEVTGGTVTYDGKDLLAMAPEERACEGVFMAFQYPVEIAASTTPTSSRPR
jgi:Fe-S cluster assembly ATP-binding protein